MCVPHLGIFAVYPVLFRCYPSLPEIITVFFHILVTSDHHNPLCTFHLAAFGAALTDDRLAGMIYYTNPERTGL